MDQLIDDCPEDDEIVATIGLLEVALTSGKWYYEIEILEACKDLQPGWARRGWEQLQPGQPGQSLPCSQAGQPGQCGQYAKESYANNC